MRCSIQCIGLTSQLRWLQREQFPSGLRGALVGRDWLSPPSRFQERKANILKGFLLLL
jgi:hypothetical protein